MEGRSTNLFKKPISEHLGPNTQRRTPQTLLGVTRADVAGRPTPVTGHSACQVCQLQSELLRMREASSAETGRTRSDEDLVDSLSSFDPI